MYGDVQCMFLTPSFKNASDCQKGAKGCSQFLGVLPPMYHPPSDVSKTYTQVPPVCNITLSTMIISPQCQMQNMVGCSTNNHLLVPYGTFLSLGGGLELTQIYCPRPMELHDNWLTSEER